MHDEKNFPRLLADYLQAQFAHLLAHEPIAREGAYPIGVHQMRVATRRLRSIISASKFLFPDKASKPLRDSLKSLARSLGAVRDRDVLLLSLADRAPALSADIASLRTAAREDLLAHLDSPDYPSLKILFEDSLARIHTPGISVPEAREKLLSPCLETVRHSARSLDPQTASDDELHRLRIGIKKLRYLAELFEITLLEEQSAALTNLLGRHQDACVEIEIIRDHAPAETHLLDQPNEIREEIRVQLPDVMKSFLESATSDLHPSAIPSPQS